MAGDWELGLGVGSHHPGTSGSLCQNVTNNMVCDEHLLSFGNLGFGYTLSRGCCHDQSPVKTLGAEALMSYPVDVSHGPSQLVAGGIKYILCDCTGGTQKLVPGFLPTPHHAPVRCADAALWSFSGINLSSMTRY